MSPEQYAAAKQLFLELCEASTDEQASRLAQTDDTLVRQEVESLLDFYEKPPPDELEPAAEALLASGASSSLPSREPSELASTGSGSAAVAALDLSPGASVNGRYRIVAKLGQGGMGEIYRADDLIMGETVALKFLHPSTQTKHLLAEARMARQVTHPNVCRVFDVDEAQGRPFISMEYIDGENLASLLQRIGRLPKDRTVYLARQLFAGLAAAHARGVLHRDLKPANIMIDGRGDVRITDFGIASREERSDRRTITAGTPAYMAPEQILGDEVTAKSDLYAVALVLYELTTGTYPFDAASRKEYLEAHLHATAPPPSARVDDLDPVLERVILKCLEKDPRDRPNSALAVAAALPGGDPLSLAVAVGETPSPEMVAEAGSQGLITATQATAGVVAVALALIAILGLADPARRLGDAGLHHPPEVLAEKARETLRRFGWTKPPADMAFGYMENSYALAPVPAGGTGPLDPSAPGASSILFWYRQSPEALEPAGLFNLTFLGGAVGPYDPPHTRAGQAFVLLHPNGMLDHLEVRPPSSPGTGDRSADSDADDEPPEPIDFTTMLRAAGLDPSLLEPQPAEFAPPFFADTLAAFRGVSNRRPDLELDLRLATHRGRPVYFRMFPVQDDEAASKPPDPTWFERLIAEWWQWWDVITILAAIFAVPLMRTNLLRGRGDRRGARRLAAFVFVTSFVLAMLRGQHLTNISTEWALVQLRLGTAMLQAGLVWLFYLTLEPYVRRIWPHTLIAWTRLLRGRFRDPLVGRNMLAGSVIGCGWALLTHLDALLPGWLGLAYEPRPVLAFQFDAASSAAATLANVIETLLASVHDAVLSLLILVMLRLLFRRPLPATVVYVAIMSALYAQNGLHPTLGWFTVGIPIAILEAVALVRFGLVAYAAAVFVAGLLTFLPITLDLSAWYAGPGLVGVFSVGVLTGLATYWARAPRLTGRGPTVSTDRRSGTDIRSSLS